MRLVLPLMLTCSLLLIFSGFYFGATRVKFASGDWDTAQSKAKAEQKLYFVDFDASYCAACRNMDESTYQDQQLATYIDQNVVALRLDVQDFDGVMWSQQYEVEALPTMLIFNEQGRLVKRLVGYKSARDLLAAFQELRNNNNATIPATPAVTNPSVSKPEPQPASEDKPLLRPVVSGSTRPAANNTAPVSPPPSPRSSTPVPTASNDSPQATGRGLFEVAVRRAQSVGYTVQLGVFSSYDALMEQADRAGKRFNTQKLMVHLDEMGGAQVFKLLLGNFASKREANLFREQLRKVGMDGLVKDLALMQ